MVSVQHTIIKNNTAKDINLGTVVIKAGVTVILPAHHIKANKFAAQARRSKQIEIISPAKFTGKAISLDTMNNMENTSEGTVVPEEVIGEEPVVEVPEEVIEEEPVAEVLEEVVEEESVVEEDSEENTDPDKNVRKRVRKPPLKK